MNSFLLRKYFSNGLRTLVRIHHLTKEKGIAYYSDIELFLNRGRNQVSTTLSKLEVDKLIQREKHHRPQKISLTPLGEKLLHTISKELQI